MLGSFFKKVAGLETRKSIKSRLQHKCSPVNIATSLGTAFSIEQLWWLLQGIQAFFWFMMHNFKLYENSMTQT